MTRPIVLMVAFALGVLVGAIAIDSIWMRATRWEERT